jgi:type IV secretion system protein VirB4
LDAHPDLQSVCLFIVIDLIWREVQRDRTKMKFTIFDECWKILQDDTAAQFIGEVFRTFRKYRASAIAISQTMDDFAKSKVAAAILPNSSIRWILKQKGADQDALRSVLQLNDREMQLISDLESQKGEFSEAFLMAEDTRLETIAITRFESPAKCSTAMSSLSLGSICSL